MTRRDALTTGPAVTYIPADSSKLASSFPSVIVAESLPKPLTADEIEALLRAARERPTAVRADVLSEEPLGPGDVQHLRNTLFEETGFVTASLSTQDDWPGKVPPDELLRQAEQQLSEAISVRSDSPGEVLATPQPFMFPELKTAPIPASSGGLPREVIDDIELDVTLELGRAEVTIEELMQLREGSVVPLDKAENDPIDILANGRLVARGEVIVVDGKFGVRICEVIASR